MQTVNVIEYKGAGNIELRSFEDTPDGNAQAEESFSAVLREAGVKKRDIKSYIEDGYWGSGEYELYLVHST
jgi:hypothetical protein